VVFLDGCYWHACPEHYTVPKTNAGYWTPKIEGNRARDVLVGRELEAAGWTVLRIWEHESADTAARRVIELVRQARSAA
jgi:DNA mismatch endonuclease (patch repair protein)